MNLTYLKYFIDTVNECSIQKAAKLNFVSQPAVSQGIKKLENELELDLLNHQRNSVNITKDGKALLKAALPLFQSIKNYKTEVYKIKNHEIGELTIGISNSLVSYVLSSALKKFSKAFPGVEVNIKVGKTNDQVGMLQKGEIDVGITINNESVDQFYIKTISKGRFILVGNSSSQDRLIMTEDRPETILFRKSLVKNRKIIFDSEIQVESWSTILDLVETGYGYGLLPDFMIKNTKLNNISEKRKLQRPSYEIVYFAKEVSMNNGIVKSFCNLLHPN
ncbi:LysR family transcriptional regulator [Bacteriovoracaceae bacterium]|nr:LysR family transcriptional regulator [Bacteriovoracaceae bacterium]